MSRSAAQVRKSRRRRRIAAPEVLLSPDGARALVRVYRNVYMITVPPVGGTAPTVSLSGSSIVPTRRLTTVGGDFVGWSDDGPSRMRTASARTHPHARLRRAPRTNPRASTSQMIKIVEAGGRVGLASHGEVQGLGTHWELWMMASGGMDRHDLLRVATLHSADAIGLARDIGSIEAGKLADLPVLDANPLDRIENSTAIRYVMKNGRLYGAATLDEVWPRQRQLPTQWWWRLEPPALR